MVKAYILLTSAIGKVRDIFEKLKDLGNVESTSMVTGPFDIIVLAEAENLSTLTETVVGEIREIEGVVNTNTAIVVE